MRGWLSEAWKCDDSCECPSDMSNMPARHLKTQRHGYAKGDILGKCGNSPSASNVPYPCWLPIGTPCSLYHIHSSLQFPDGHSDLAFIVTIALNGEVLPLVLSHFKIPIVFNEFSSVIMFPTLSLG